MHSSIKAKLLKKFQNPPMILGISFAAVILIGALLLNTPMASINNEPIGFINALFTASSATCVTGLVVVNSAYHWTLFGKIVIISLIQIGGLGTMVLFTMVAMLLKMKIGLRQRLMIREQLNTDTLTGIVKLSKYIISISFLIELIGAILLSIRFIPEYGLKTGIWYSVFHSISSFCNAGFDIMGDSILPYNTDWLVNLTIMGLIIVGGLGFAVYIDIYTKKRFEHFNLHTKMVLIVTVTLLVLGTILILLIEYNNPETIGNYGFTDKVLISSFQSTITRTAGFYSTPVDKLYDATVFVMIILMFIGGSPASTAGGLKTTTFGVLLFSTISTIRGDRDVVYHKKSISTNTIMKALAITIICIGLVIFMAFSVSIIEKEKFQFIDILFETVSAFATVGVSRGITPELSDLSKFLISFTMYLGRIGPTTLAVAILGKNKVSSVKYAEGTIIVG